MLKKEVRDQIQKYVHPFHIIKGQGFQLKDFDPADTCGFCHFARVLLSVLARVSSASPGSASWQRRASPAMQERPLSLVQCQSMFR